MTSPRKFAHVVFNTHRYDEMIAWYLNVFEARCQHRDDRLAFITYDDEHHRMAFVNLGPLPEDPPKKRMGKGPGLNHLAYTWDSLGDLVSLYKRLRTDGITPVRPIRHGPTLSRYYADPDGNLLEFQIDLLDPAAAVEFMDGSSFEANPIGEPFDPVELAARYDAGNSVDEIVFRSDQEVVALAH